jgi:hypothetical protein
LLITCALPEKAASDTSSLADTTAASEIVEAGSNPAFELFLDRLMRAESNGRENAANPRSTALGPFQFIKSTFLEIAHRHFADEVAGLTDEQVLELRTKREFARSAAAAYTKDNLAALADRGIDNPTFGHLRLAFLVGPSAAARLIQASPTTPVSSILVPGVLKANPFMAGMNAMDLLARAGKDVSADPREANDMTPHPRVRVVGASPRPRVRASVLATPKGHCNEKLVSCRRFMALQQRREKQPSRESRSAGPAQRHKRSG